MGDIICVTPDKVDGTKERVSIQYETILQDLDVGMDLFKTTIANTFLN